MLSKTEFQSSFESLCRMSYTENRWVGTIGQSLLRRSLDNLGLCTVILTMPPKKKVKLSEEVAIARPEIEPHSVWPFSWNFPFIFASVSCISIANTALICLGPNRRSSCSRAIKSQGMGSQHNSLLSGRLRVSSPRWRSFHFYGTMMHSYFVIMIHFISQGQRTEDINFSGSFILTISALTEPPPCSFSSILTIVWF